MKVRCPHCHNPIEVLQDSAALDSDIECPSCGSSFNLLRESETVSYEPEKRKQVAHFELLDRLGTGAFGAVWKARDTQLDRIVAIKIPRKSQLDEEETEKFLREARASAQLRHPNIVSVHEVGRDGPTVYIAADLIEGLTLSDWLTGQRLTPREAAELCVKLADAVHHAHECGVIHRDLKPSNVMLNAAGEPFVMDFGLAKREAGEITMTVDGQIIGTPAYMAPEQARGESHHVDRRSDVYSLGVLLFELLTGERPFRGNARMLLYQVINDEPPSPRRLNAAIPKDLETICLKCLEKDRAKRFATAHDLANELRRYLRGEPILSRPVSQAERLWRWSKRNPVIATLTASIAALILFLLVAGPVVFFREKRLRLDAQTSETSAKQAQRSSDKAKNEAVAALAQEEKSRKAAENAESQSQLDLERASLHAKAASLARDTVVVSRDTIRRNLYFAEMGLAHQALLDHDLAQVNQILDRHIPADGETDLRGFEWYYLRHAGHRHKHHFTAVGAHGAAVSPTDDLIAVDGASLDGESNHSITHLLDSEKFWRQVELPGTMRGMHCIAFSSDGRCVASGDQDGFVAIRSIADRKLLWRVQPYGREYLIEAVAFSPDGSRLAVTCGGTSPAELKDVLVLNTVTGEVERRFPTKDGFASSLFYAANDELIAGAAYERLYSWNPLTGQSHWIYPTENDVASEAPGNNWITSFARSPDQQTLAVATNRGSVRLIDPKSGKTLMQRDEHRHRVNQVAFSPDGTLLASAAEDGTCLLRNPKALSVIAAIEHGHVWARVSFTRDGKSLVTSGGWLKVWNLDEVLSQAITLNSVEGSGVPMTVSADGQLIATSGSGKIQVRRVGQPAPIVEIADGGVDLQFRMVDNQWQLVVTNPVHTTVWDIANNRELSRIKFEAGPSGMRASCLSSDGRLIAIARTAGGGPPNDIQIWELDTGNLIRTLSQTTGYGFALAFTPDDSQLYSVHPGRDVCGIMLWNLTDGTCEVIRPDNSGGPNHRAAINLQLGLIASSVSRAIDVFDLKERKSIATCTGHAGDVMSLAIIPDGKRIASGAIDNTVRLWDIPSGQVTQIHRDHRGQVDSLAVTPNGDTLFSVARDNTLRTWRASGMSSVAGRNRIASIEFSPDGRLIATSGTDDRKLRVWDRATRKLLIEVGEPNATPSTIAFSADASRVAVRTESSTDQGALVYEVKSGKLLRKFSFGSGRSGGPVAFSSDGSRLILASRTGLSVWSIQSGQQERNQSSKPPISPNWPPERATVSPDGTQLMVSENSGVLRLWKLETLEEIRTIKVFESPAHTIHFLNADTVLAASTDGVVRTIDLKTGDMLAKNLGSYRDLRSATCSRDGNRVFLGLFDEASIVELELREAIFHEVRRWRDSERVTSLSLSPDGQELLSGTHDGWANFWSTETTRGIGRLVARGDKAHYPADVESVQSAAGIPNPLWYFNNEKPLPNEPNRDIFEMTLHARGTDLAFSPDGKLVAATVGTEVRVWDMAMGERKWTFNRDKFRLLALEFTPDSKSIAAGGCDSVIRFWNLESGEIVREFPGRNQWRQITDFIFTRDGQTMARFASADPGLVEVFDLASQSLKGMARTQTRWQHWLAFSPDETKLLAVAKAGGHLHVWSLPELQPLYTSESDKIRVGLFDPQAAEILTAGLGGADLSGRRLKLDDWTAVSEFPALNVGYGAISPDSRYLAKGFGWGEIGLVDLTVNQDAPRRPMRHLVRIARLQFSPDPKNYVLGSIGWEGIVKLWNPETGELIRRLE